MYLIRLWMWRKDKIDTRKENKGKEEKCAKVGLIGRNFLVKLKTQKVEVLHQRKVQKLLTLMHVELTSIFKAK